MRLPHAVTVACLSASMGHAILIGSAHDPNLWPNVGALYSIDSVTGATTPLDLNFYLYGLADSPFPATVFGSSTVNLYTLNLNTGNRNFYNAWGAENLAYDARHNMMYGANISSLFITPMSPCHDSNCPQAQRIGDLPNSGPWALGYVPGEGLYGVSGAALYRIDTNDAAVTFIGHTFVLVPGGWITDIEFDPATGRTIAVAADLSCLCGPPAFGHIYSLDRTTGELTLLNDHAPNFVSLAVATPEPSALLLAGGALILLGLRRRRGD